MGAVEHGMPRFLASIACMNSGVMTSDILLDGTSFPFCIIIVATMLRGEGVVRFLCIVKRFPESIVVMYFWGRSTRRNCLPVLLETVEYLPMSIDAEVGEREELGTKMIRFG